MYVFWFHYIIANHDSIPFCNILLLLNRKIFTFVLITKTYVLIIITHQFKLNHYPNSSENILTPFAGVGSEVYMATKLGRKGIGIELKESYFKQMVKNLQTIEESTQIAMID